MCLKESCVPDCWKVSSVVPVYKNVEERSTAKNYRPVSLLSVVSKVFEKLVNNRIVDHLEKCGLFSDFQYGFRSFRSTADLLTVCLIESLRSFNRSEATPFFISNQKFKRSPGKSLIFKQFLNNLPGRTKDEHQTIHCEKRLEPFFCLGNLREMLTFGFFSSKVYITYSRCLCNKLWRCLESLYHGRYEHPWHQRARQLSTKRNTVKYK